MNRLTFYFDRIGREGNPPGQPKPLVTKICRMQIAGRWVTSLWRAWRYDDVPACRLCSTYSAVGGECLLLIGERISDEAAPLYRIKGLPERSP